jgi:hypothetical protein
LIAAAIASPTPVLPLVGSTMVPPGRSQPLRSASSTMRMPIRSLTEPPGFINSSLATSGVRMPAARRSSRTSGVPPIAAITCGRISPVVPAIPPNLAEPARPTLSKV